MRDEVIQVGLVGLAGEAASPTLTETARGSASLVPDGRWRLFGDGHEHHGGSEHFDRGIPDLTIEGRGRRRRVVHGGGMFS